jgi:hypothetical protein
MLVLNNAEIGCVMAVIVPGSTVESITCPFDWLRLVSPDGLHMRTKIDVQGVWVGAL